MSVESKKTSLLIELTIILSRISILNRRLMITGKQIKSARIFLEWTAQELSKRTSISTNTISNIEIGNSTPRENTLETITKVFNEAGIEFIGTRGFTKKDDMIQKLTGENVFCQLLNDVVETLKKEKNKEALFLYAEDRLSTNLIIEHYNTLRKKGIVMRSLLKEGDNFYHGKKNEYRCLPAQYFVNTPSIIYADKVAIMLYNKSTQNPDKIKKSATIIQNQPYAESVRNMFEYMWNTTEKPTSLTTAPMSYNDV